MFKKTFAQRFSPFLGLIIVLLLLLIFTGVAHAVYRNNKISGPIIAGGGVLEFQISPDGQYTVFRGDTRENDQNELFSVRTLGGERVRLSIDLDDECDIGGFLITPDSQQVVYWGGGDAVCVVLQSVPIGGGTSVELNQASDDEYPHTIQITSDSANVVFILSSYVPRMQRLFRVPIGGGPRQAVSDWHTGIIQYEIAPNNLSVVYVQDPWPDPGDKVLYKSSLAGETTRLDEGDIDRFIEVSPDGEYVIYRKNTGSGYELFSLPIESEPTTRIKLNGDLVPGGNVNGFQITPDSAYVVYMADETVDNMTLLYRAPIDESAARIHLLPTMAANPAYDVISFKISPDSQSVVFQGDFYVDGRYDLFSVSINGGTINPLNPGMIDEGDVGTYMITPNSQHVAFIADYAEDGVDELFAVTINGTQGGRLNTILHGDRDVTDFKITNNSLGVVYRADQEVNDVFNLYAVIPGNTPVQLNPPLVSGGNVNWSFQITPDDKGVVYIADQETYQVSELFVTYNFQPPTNIILSSTSVDENQPINTVVGTFSTNDPDTGDSHTYALVTGDGDADNGWFNISGNKLRTGDVFNYDTKPSFTIRVRTTDQGGLPFEKIFTITVQDLPESSLIFLPLVVR